MSEENKPEAPEVAEEESKEPEAPAERMFSQSEVAALLAKEHAKAKRKAKRDFEAQMAEQTKEEPTASAGQALDPRVDELSEKLAAMERANREAEFRAATAGLEVSEDEKGMLLLAFEGNRELFDKRVASLKAADRPPDPKGTGFTGTGAAPNPNADPARKLPSEWTKEDVATLRANGTFLQRLNEYRNSLPGGGGGLFPAKKHKAG